MVERFGLVDVIDSLPASLPLGIRQRLSLAVAMVHKPELLILDEPTSGVDPVARDAFWRLLIELSRRDRVTVFISTHFMNEAERCDRMSMMHAGKVLDSDVPARLVEKRGAKTLEEAFIGYLVEGRGRHGGAAGQPGAADHGEQPSAAPAEHIGHRWRFQPAAHVQLSVGATLELQRDPVRATLALGGSLLLMFAIGFGITLDVEDLSYAVLDRDQTTLSQNYTLNLAGSRYFIRAPAYRRLRGSRPAHAQRRTVIGHRNPRWLCPRCVAGPERADRCVARRRHAAARRNRPGLRSGHAPALAAGTGQRTQRAAAPQAMRASRRAFATTPMSRACRPWCRR